MAPARRPAAAAAPTPAEPELAYNKDLRAEIETQVSPAPRAHTHRAEWRKLMEGDPVQINPSLGDGFKVMSVEEWAGRFRRNDDFPHCLACSGTNTKEHHFTQTWCRGKKTWESEAVCLDCHAFSWRSYRDPDFMMPEEYEKARWNKLVKEVADAQRAQQAIMGGL